MPWYQFDGEKVFRDPCAESEPPFPMSEVKIPVALFHSRSAPLGIGFVPTGAMDSRFEHSAIIAIHGSWVRSQMVCLQDLRRVVDIPPS